MLRARGCGFWDFIFDWLSVLSEVVDCTFRFTFFKPFWVYLCIFYWICDLGGYAPSKGVLKDFVVRKGFPLDSYPVTILSNSWF